MAHSIASRTQNSSCHQKVCSSCKEEKTLDFFYEDKKRRQPRHHCMDCEKAARVARQREKTYPCFLFKLQYLKNNPCEICGIIDALTCEFDHKREFTKEYNISYLASKGRLELMKIEIAKCRVLCASCHSLKTSIEQWHGSFLIGFDDIWETGTKEQLKKIHRAVLVVCEDYPERYEQLKEYLKPRIRGPHEKQYY